jgi:CelD/BcsL family acetyltransferase involved in cellulose biosynthesis
VLPTRAIDPIADPEWLGLVATSPSAEIFHHPRWLELLRSQYGYDITALVVGEPGATQAGIPIARIESRLTGRRLVALPFSDVCSPALAPGAGPAALDALGAALVEEAERSGLGLTVHAPVPAAPGTIVGHRFYRHLLPLDPDPAAVERGYSKSQIKRGIKKALREGLVAERRTDVAALDAFYALHVKTRQRLGVPTQPKRFIQGFERLFAAGLGFVELILDAGRPIAAAVFLTHNGTITYKYGASAERSLGKRPNNLLFSAVIREACEGGFHTLDFGRTDLDNTGLRSFKRSWGAVESDLAYTYIAAAEPASEPALRERIMTTTIQRSPAIVSRLAGEALYGHFG